jgi:hypothetical protein
MSGIDVEEVERHGCPESRDGPGMALRGVPLEQRWSEASNEPEAKRGAGCRGKPFWFLLAGPAIRATAKRDPPSGAEPMPEATRKRSEQVAWK